LYLKSLEIHGFKSFADKTKLEFGPGITCIVGPNGSGKSNICDALRWVLGEQSIKSLRGSKLEDVIFSGSEKRKPLGMADVTLVFDNASGLLPLAFDEITVSRRVYRSGESEFLINKVPCRLKDIQELFNDTGVGKEAFAIIGQGQVDAILSSRPEERRALFEEAAGIIRYRNRKLEAARKLESTDVNLARLQDLLFEIEQNLPPLKEEAQKAQQHQQWSKELEALEISLTCLDLKKLSEAREKVLAQEQELEKKIWEQESSHALLTTEWEQSQLAKQQLEEQQRKRQEELFRLQQDLNKNQSDMTIAKDRVAIIQERESKLQEEINQNKDKLLQLEQEYADRQQEYDELVTAGSPQQEALTDSEQELSGYQQELTSCQEKEEQLKDALFDAEQKLVSLNNKQLELQFELRNIKQQSLRLKENTAENELRRKELQEQLELNSSELSEQKGRLQQLKQQQEELMERKKELEQQVSSLRAEMEKVSQARHSVYSRIRVLEEMKESLEGYQAGVRSLFRNPVANGELKILGVVGELLKVPSQYERAIETALGSAVQNLVTETDEEAQKAIQWLKKEKAGRATLLPLNTLKPRKLAKEYQPLLGVEGVLGLASELVQIVPGKEIVLDYLLGTIVVVKDLSVGRAVARKSRYSLKIVTLDGDVLFPGGSLTGGSRQSVGTGLLGRNREIGEQRNKLNKLEAKLAELKQVLRDREQQQKDLETQWQQLQEETGKLALGIESREAERERLKQELFNQGKITERELWEEEQLLAQEADLQLQLEEVEDEKAAAAIHKEKLRQEQQQNRAREELLNQKLQSLSDRLTEQKVVLASQREKLKSLENALAYAKQNRQEALEMQERLELELAQLAEQKASLGLSLAQLEEREIQLVLECQQLENGQKRLEAELVEAQTRLRSLDAELNQLSKVLKELKEEHHQVAMQLTRLEVEWDNAVSRLQEKFQLTWEEAKGRQLELTSRREAENRVRILKKELNELGLVNPNAMAEYERLEERFRFLKTQQEDLLEARKGLFKIIDEMEKIMGRRFKETFEEVEIAFQDVFTYLFNGGKATLQLTDAGNLLESGIDIIAQPPGKKMQNLSLLSGGERALTATALLFALLKVKPSPFCVLDEIESNLDDVNVERVAQFIREFTEQTQFIVVSHRQGTMEAADALYGVTMEEKGVSRLISVKLTPTGEVV
jgi:chromosome segregation protein